MVKMRTAPTLSSSSRVVVSTVIYLLFFLLFLDSRCRVVFVVNAADLRINVKQPPSPAPSRPQPQRPSSATAKEEGTESSTSSVAVDGDRRTIEDYIKLDFSGDIECHLIGPAQNGLEEEASATPVPLFGILPPRLSNIGAFVGLHYDFSQAWYGATCLRARIRWLPPRKIMLAPCRIEVRGEKQLKCHNPDEDMIAGEVSAGWKLPLLGGEDATTSARYGSRETSIATRFDSSGLSTLSMTLPFHRRLEYRCELCRDSTTTSNSSGRVPELTTRDIDYEPPWWIPNLNFDAGGNIKARTKQAIFRHPIREKDDCRLGLRVKATRRSFRGLLLGAADDSDAELSTSTVLSLELSDLTPQTVTGIQLQTQIEQPLDSASLCIQQQFYSQNGPFSVFSSSEDDAEKSQQRTQTHNQQRK